MSDLTARILVGMIFLSALVIAGSYRYRAQKGERFGIKEEGKAIAVPLRLAGLVIWLYPFLYVFAPKEWVSWSLVELPAGVRWMGVVLGVATFPLIIWAQNSLGNNVSTTVVIREGHELITDGPYRWIRHPLYTGGMMMFTGLTLISGSWLMGVVSVVGMVFILIRLPKEEGMLLEAYGDKYRDYQKRTGRFFPKLI